MTQAANLTRCAEKLSAAVLAFCRPGREFHGGELESFVMAHAQATPGSAARVMRLLRQRGLVNVVLVSRRDSLYRVLPVVLRKPEFTVEPSGQVVLW